MNHMDQWALVPMDQWALVPNPKAKQTTQTANSTRHHTQHQAPSTVGSYLFFFWICFCFSVWLAFPCIFHWFSLHFPSLSFVFHRFSLVFLVFPLVLLHVLHFCIVFHRLSLVFLVFPLFCLHFPHFPLVFHPVLVGCLCFFHWFCFVSVFISFIAFSSFLCVCLLLFSFMFSCFLCCPLVLYGFLLHFSSLFCCFYLGYVSWVVLHPPSASPTFGISQPQFWSSNSSSVKQATWKPIIIPSLLVTMYQNISEYHVLQQKLLPSLPIVFFSEVTFEAALVQNGLFCPTSIGR